MGGCLSSPANANAETGQVEKSENASSTNNAKPVKTNNVDAEKERVAAEKKEQERLEQEKAQREREEQLQREEEERKQQLEEKLGGLSQEFLSLLDSDMNGFISADELRVVYPKRADKFMKIADRDGNNALDVEEVKALFRNDDGSPDIETLMELTSKVDDIKSLRAEKEAKAKREAEEREFNDAATTFLRALQDSLGGKVSQDELKLVYNKPVEKYNAVFEAEELSDDLVKTTFTDGETLETAALQELTEAFRGVKEIRDNEDQFDLLLDDFFQDIESQTTEGLNLDSLKQFYPESASDVMSALDKDNDGKIDRTEMKPMFRNEATGMFDLERLASVRGGFGDALVAKRAEELRLLEEEFDSALAGFMEMFQAVEPQITEEELATSYPDTAANYVPIVCTTDGANVKAFFTSGEYFDTKALLLLKEAVAQILDARLAKFNEDLANLKSKLVASWVAKLKLDELVEECPNQAGSYEAIIASEGNIEVEELQAFFTPDGNPDYAGLATVFDRLTKIEATVMKKFDKQVRILKAFIEKRCLKYKISRDEVFQVYVDEMRVGDFDKKFWKLLLNKQMDELPDLERMRKLFTHKKTKEPSVKLIKGFKKALEKITDVRRLSQSQADISLGIEYEKLLAHCIATIDGIEEEARLQCIQGLFSEHGAQAEEVHKQLIESHSGSLNIELIKPLWMGPGSTDYDMTGLSQFINDFSDAAKDAPTSPGKTQEKRDPETTSSADLAASKRNPETSQTDLLQTNENEEELAPVQINVQEAQEKVEQTQDQGGDTLFDEPPEDSLEEFDEPVQVQEQAEQVQEQAEQVQEQAEQVQEQAEQAQEQAEQAQEQAEVQEQAQEQAEVQEQAQEQENLDEFDEFAEEPAQSQADPVQSQADPVQSQADDMGGAEIADPDEPAQAQQAADPPAQAQQAADPPAQAQQAADPPAQANQGADNAANGQD